MTTIDGVELVSATIDGVDVQEITIDGVVAWTAGEPTIANYLEDDWGDNSLSTRTNPADGVYASPSAIRAGDTLIGRYRPEWSVTNGSPSATSGYLSLPGNDTTPDRLRTTSKWTTGTLQYDARQTTLQSSSTTALIIMSFIHQDPNNKIFSYFRDDSGTTQFRRLTKTVSGTGTELIKNDTTPDTNWHTTKITRSAYGDWEAFWDGVSYGTATDSFLPDNNHRVRIKKQGYQANELRMDNVVYQ